MGIFWLVSKVVWALHTPRKYNGRVQSNARGGVHDNPNALNFQKIHKPLESLTHLAMVLLEETVEVQQKRSMFCVIRVWLQPPIRVNWCCAGGFPIPLYIISDAV